MSTTTNPNPVPSSVSSKAEKRPNSSDKQQPPSTTANEKSSTSAPKLNQTEDTSAVKKEQKSEASAEPQVEKTAEKVEGKTEAKDVKVQNENKNKEDNKQSELKSANGKVEEKEKVVQDDRNESQTVIYERETSREVIKLTNLKGEKKDVLEHKTSLETGNDNREVKKEVGSNGKEKKEEKQEKLKTKSSLGKKVEEEERKSEKSDKKDKEAISSIDIDKNDEVRLTESDSKVMETKMENTESSSTRKADGKEKEEVAFKKKVEKIVEEKMQKEVDKLVEKKMEKIMIKNELPLPQPQPQLQESVIVLSKMDKLGYMTNPKESVSDRYLFSSPNQSDYGTNSTLGKHTRFWEIEKRMQELKEKHNRSCIEQASIKEQKAEKSYISSIRDRLTSLPPLMSNLNNYETQSPKEETQVYQTQTEEVPKRVGREARARSIEDSRGHNKQLDNSKKTKSKLLPQLLPQNQQINRRNEQPNTMPKLYETYLGKDFVKKVVNKLEGGTGKARSNSVKPTASSAKKGRLVEQQVFRLVTQEKDGQGYQIVGFSSNQTNNVTTTEEREGVFFVEEQRKEKKMDERGHMYGSVEMGNNSSRRNSARNSQTKGDYNSNPTKNQSQTQYVTNLRGNKTSSSQVNNQVKGSNLLKTNVKNNQYQSAGRGVFNGIAPKNNVDNGMAVKKAKRSSSVIAEVNESSNLVASAATFNGSQEVLKKMTPSRKNSMQRIDSGSLIRQVYRVKGMSRQGSTSDIEEGNNMTVDVAEVNKSNLIQPTRERRRSNDFSLLTGKKGFGFTTAQRTRVIDNYESPGPKYDLSSYKSLVGGNKLRVEDYVMSKRSSSKSPDARSMNKNGEREHNQSPDKDASQLSMRSNKGAVFGTARRDNLFKYKPGTPGPADYNIPQMKKASGVQFGKERRSFRGVVFPGNKNV